MCCCAPNFLWANNQNLAITWAFKMHEDQCGRCQLLTVQIYVCAYVIAQKSVRCVCGHWTHIGEKWAIHSLLCQKSRAEEMDDEANSEMKRVKKVSKHNDKDVWRGTTEQQRKTDRKDEYTRVHTSLIGRIRTKKKWCRFGNLNRQFIRLLFDL